MLTGDHQNLQPADLLRLDHFLHSRACGRDSMGLSYAHGFLSSIASGPEQLEASEWLRLMFDEPVFEGGDEANEMLGLAVRLFQETEQGLVSANSFRPVFEYVPGPDGEARADARPWCIGYLDGLTLFSECWTADANQALQLPLGLVSQLARHTDVAHPSYTQLCDSLPDAVGVIYRYWHRHGIT